MKVSIKNLAVDMEIKNTGIELAVHDNDGKFMGDLVVTKTKLIWCHGKTARKNGKSLTWAKFTDYMESLK